MGGQVTIHADRDATVHAILFWWDLRMVKGDANPLTESPPRWGHGATTTGGTAGGDRPFEGVLTMAPGLGWRDHWRQNLCVLERPIQVRAEKGTSSTLLRACT